MPAGHHGAALGIVVSAVAMVAVSLEPLAERRRIRRGRAVRSVPVAAAQSMRLTFA